MIGRLKAGVTLAAAQAAVDTMTKGFVAAYPRRYPAGAVRLSLSPLDEEVASDVRPALFALSGAVAFVLLVACANLMNLLLARACARTRELAVRAAIGASRQRLVAQLATESLAVGLIGAGLGLIVAQWGVEGFCASPRNAAAAREHRRGLDGCAVCGRHIPGLLAALRARARLAGDQNGCRRDDEGGSGGHTACEHDARTSRRGAARVVARAARRRRPHGTRVHPDAIRAARLRIPRAP